MADWDALEEAKRVLDKANNLQHSIDKETSAMERAANIADTCMQQSDNLSKDLLSHTQTMKEKITQSHAQAEKITQSLSQLHSYEIQEISTKVNSSLTNDSRLVNLANNREKRTQYPNAELPPFNTPNKKQLSDIPLNLDCQEGQLWKTVSDDFKTLDEIEREVAFNLDQQEMAESNKIKEEFAESSKLKKEENKTRKKAKES